MEIDKILIATDGSDESEKAIEFAAYLAGVFGSEVTALYVSEIHFPLTSLFPVYEDVILDIADKTEDKFRKRFKELSGTFKEKGIDFSSNIIRDGTVEGITETAKKQGAGLIVMGKSGLGFIAETIIGSNTIKVLRKADVPVLAVRSADDLQSKGISKILVPVDISDVSVSPIADAMEIAETLGAQIYAVYVFWLNGTAYDIPPKLVDELLERSKSEFSKIVQRELETYVKAKGSETNIEIKDEVIHGVSPSISLREYAKNNSIDLILVKTHGRKGISRLLYGSETERIIQEAPCSVLAVK